MTTPKGNLLKRFATGKSFKERIHDTSAMSPAIIMEDEEALAKDASPGLQALTPASGRESKNQTSLVLKQSEGSAS